MYTWNPKGYWEIRVEPPPPNPLYGVGSGSFFDLEPRRGMYMADDGGFHWVEFPPLPSFGMLDVPVGRFPLKIGSRWVWYPDE